MLASRRLLGAAAAAADADGGECPVVLAIPMAIDAGGGGGRGSDFVGGGNVSAGEALSGVTRSGTSSGASCGLRGRVGEELPGLGAMVVVLLW